MTTARRTVDLTDVDVFVEGAHHEMFAWLRQHAPVYWNPSDGGGFWALTRYDDVLRAYRDHAAFSSARGAILGGSFRSSADTAAGRMLVASDLPRHRLLREAMHRMFAAPVVARVQRQVVALVDAVLDRLCAAGGGDFAGDVAPQLPAGALMVTLNIGHEDALELISLTRRMIGFRDPSYVDGGDDERVRLAWIQSEIFEFFAELVRARRTDRGDDLVSTLLNAQVNGRALPEEDVLYNCMNVAVGGNETSSYTACTGMEALLGAPDEYERLLAEPALLDTAIDEILRWASTNAYVQRVATRDIEIGDQLIREGDSVTLWNASANRDGSRFPEANRFDVARSPNRHLTFGNGIHRCIGASTGEVELTTLFGRLVDRRIRLVAAGPVRRLRSNFILGTVSLPVEVL
jgi:cytochrome P450